MKATGSDERLFSYIKTFIVPTLVLKSFVMYFGLNYSISPGEGYGWGLFFSIAISLLNFAIFIWKNWNDSDEGDPINN